METAHGESSEMINLETVCRICAEQLDKSDKLINFYDPQGLSNDLVTKINTYLPIRVTESDELPLHCCLGCATTIIMWHDLVQAAVRSDRKLHSALEDRTITRIEYNDDDGDTPEEDTPEMILPDIILPDSETISNDFCQTVNKVKRKPKATKRNLRKQKFPKEEEEVQVKIEVKNGSESGNEDALSMDDVKDKLMPVFSCIYCKVIFISEDDVSKHIMDAHPGNEIKIEPLLQDIGDDDKSDRKKRAYVRKNTKIDQAMTNEAKVIINGRVYYNCKECGKSLHSPYTYVWHMRIHTGERPYVCDLCGKQFRVSQGLVRHLRETHEGIKKFPCDICGRMFATRRNVEEHRRIHTNERPYICDLCGKSFKQKASLFVHKRSHRDFFPFRCSYCNQGFRTKSPLVVHMTRHTGEKPFECEVCERQFRIKHELKRHQLVHSDVKPFQCSSCGISFRQKRYLKNHMKTNHLAIYREDNWETV